MNNILIIPSIKPEAIQTEFDIVKLACGLLLVATFVFFVCLERSAEPDCKANRQAEKEEGLYDC